MAKSIAGILILIFVLSFVLADSRTHREKRERQWKTPPELSSDPLVKMSDNGESQARLLSLIPVTATLNFNTGQNNARSISLDANLEGISLSESNSYNYPGHSDGSPVSLSKSSTVSAGLSGISTADAEASVNGNNAKTNSRSLNFGQAKASSYGIVENGKAITGAGSSIGMSQSFATTGQVQSTLQSDAVTAKNRNRRTWHRFGPNNNQHNARPTLTIFKPHDGTRDGSVILKQQKPMVHIYKWRPNQRAHHSRPNLSIESHLHNPRTDQIINRSPDLHIKVIRTRPRTGESSDSFGEGYSKDLSISGHGSGSSVMLTRPFVRFPKSDNTQSQTIPLQFNNSKTTSKQSESDIFSDIADGVGELLGIA